MEWLIAGGSVLLVSWGVAIALLIRRLTNERINIILSHMEDTEE